MNTSNVYTDSIYSQSFSSYSNSIWSQTSLATSASDITRSYNYRRIREFFLEEKPISKGAVLQPTLQFPKIPVVRKTPPESALMKSLASSVPIDCQIPRSKDGTTSRPQSQREQDSHIRERSQVSSTLRSLSTNLQAAQLTVARGEARLYDSRLDSRLKHIRPFTPRESSDSLSPLSPYNINDTSRTNGRPAATCVGIKRIRKTVLNLVSAVNTFASMPTHQSKSGLPTVTNADKWHLKCPSSNLREPIPRNKSFLINTKACKCFETSHGIILRSETLTHGEGLWRTNISSPHCLLCGDRISRVCSETITHATNYQPGLLLDSSGSRVCCGQSFHVECVARHAKQTHGVLRCPGCEESWAVDLSLGCKIRKAFAKIFEMQR